MRSLRTFCTLLVAVVLGACLATTSALVVGAPAQAADSVTRDSLKTRAIYYLSTGRATEQSVMVGTLTSRSSFEGRLWSRFLSSWATINKSMTMNPAVPTGLPKKGHVFVVLGSGLRSSGAVTAKFERRLRLAAKAAKAYPAATVLITGGAARHGRTEAEAGYRWLRSAGVRASRLLRETRSASTIGNAEYSMALLAGHSEYTSYSLISDSSHLRRASVLFEAATLLVQQRTGRSWGIRRLANVAHIDMVRAGHGPLKASSVAIAADNVASLFSLRTDYLRLVAKAPAKPDLTGLRITPPSSRRYRVGQSANRSGLAAEAVYNGGTYTNVVTSAATVSGFTSGTVGSRRATVSYRYRGVTRTAHFDYRVVRAGSTTTAKTSTGAATRSRTRVVLTATVKSSVSGVKPTGSVRFYLDGTRVADVRLGATRAGIATLRYPTIARAGSHRLTATYRGDGRVESSTRTVIITVKR